MKKSILFLSAISFIALVATSCKHDPSSVARVKYLGNPNADSCGYVLEIAGQDFHPVNLDPQFQNDTLMLDITFKYKDSFFNCTDTLEEIEIVEASIH
jgi:hypothetical protein